MAIAQIRKGRKQLLLRRPTFKTWYWFVLRGNNGEIIGTSEMYEDKESAEKTLKRYFPTFEVRDMTNEKDYKKFGP